MVAPTGHCLFAQEKKLVQFPPFSFLYFPPMTAGDFYFLCLGERRRHPTAYSTYLGSIQVHLHIRVPYSRHSRHLTPKIAAFRLTVTIPCSCNSPIEQGGLGCNNVWAFNHSSEKCSGQGTNSVHLTGAGLAEP
jgi:hypothetical protein